MPGIWREIRNDKWKNIVNGYIIEITEEVPFEISHRLYHVEVTMCDDTKLVQPPRLNKKPFYDIDNAREFAYNWIGNHGKRV